MRFEPLERWGVVALGGALVVVAALINRFSPTKRRRIRHAFLLFVLYAVLAGSEQLLEMTRAPSAVTWTEHVHLVTGLVAAFTCVNLAALVVFDLVLPALGVVLVAITADILVGFAYLFAALGILKAAGASPSSVVTTSAIASGVLALSLQTTLGNVVGGLALHLDGSLHVGDWLKLPDGIQGKVVAIRWRHTVLETRDWDTVVVPNASLLAQNIVILGKRAGQPVLHRMWVYFNVDFRFPPARVIDVVEQAIDGSAIEGVATEPPPNVICQELAKDGRDSFGCYAVRYWLTDLAKDDPTSSRVRARIFMALKRAEIPLARPSRTLFVTQEEDEIARTTRHKGERQRAIEGVTLLESLTEAERSDVATRLLYAPFGAGETVTRQGAVAHWLYILCAGTVEVRRHGVGIEAGLVKVVATITAPGFFGEMGLLTGAPRTADVVAVTNVECYRLDKEVLARILKQRPEVAAQISHTVASREVGLESAEDGLDAEGKRRRASGVQTRMLDKIQDFFGLARTGAS